MSEPVYDIPELTDEECNAFRRLPGSFNDMIRKTRYAGIMAGAQKCCELAEYYEGGKYGMYDLIEDVFDFRAS